MYNEIEDLDTNLKITFLGTGSNLLDKTRNNSSFLLVLESQKFFLFNCGENTYRNMLKSEFKMQSLMGIFITDFTPDCIAGLPGLLCSLDRNPSYEFNIYGSVKTCQFIKTTLLDKPNLHCNIKYRIKVTSLNGYNKIILPPNIGSRNERPYEIMYSIIGDTISYIIKQEDQKLGNYNEKINDNDSIYAESIKKAYEKKQIEDPKLKPYKGITSVYQIIKKYPNFTISYKGEEIKISTDQRFRNTPKKGVCVCYVNDVTHHQNILELLEEQEYKCHTLIHKYTYSEDIGKYARILNANQIFVTNFTIELGATNANLPILLQYKDDVIKHFINPNVILTSDNTSIELKLIYQGILNILVEKYNNEQEYNNDIIFKRIKSYVPDSKLSLCFLGTSSMLASRTRNFTSIALNLDDNKFILFDCGEGTIRQILDSRSNLSFNNLYGIFLTHLHSDHINGLITVLVALNDTISTRENKEFYIYTPHQNILERFLSYITPFIRYNLRIVDLNINMDTSSHNIIKKSEMITLSDNVLNEISILGFPVIHQYHNKVMCQTNGYIIKDNDICLCLVIDSKEPRKGKEVLNTIGYSCDLLVHEATNAFVDEHGNPINKTPHELNKEALEHNHSTASMAGEFAKDFDAKLLVLTHFSSRYSGDLLFPNLKTMNAIRMEASRTFGRNRVITARDFMTIYLNNDESKIENELIDLQTDENIQVIDRELKISNKKAIDYAQRILKEKERLIENNDWREKANVDKMIIKDQDILSFNNISVIPGDIVLKPFLDPSEVSKVHN